jgi:aspartyl-tRNA(Asn)/glutamyl-tRNA(Gln) amidotransferase subunit A
MARSVRDVALLMQIIADPPTEEWTAAMPGMLPPRLGRPRGFFEKMADPVVNEMMDQTAKIWKTKGAAVTEIVLPREFNDVVARHRTVMAVEAASYHRKRLARHQDEYDPNIRTLLEEGIACSEQEYARAKAHQQSLKNAMAGVLNEIDAIICPATTTPAPDAATTGDPAFNSPWSYTGLPVVAFPTGFSKEGLPLAVQFIGRAGDEKTLFQSAAWGEESLGFHIGEPRPCP